MYCRVFSIILGLHQILVTLTSKLRQLKMSSEISKCLLGDKITSTENCWNLTEEVNEGTHSAFPSYGNVGSCEYNESHREDSWQVRHTWTQGKRQIIAKIPGDTRSCGDL